MEQKLAAADIVYTAQPPSPDDMVEVEPGKMMRRGDYKGRWITIDFSKPRLFNTP
jgi:hypothetical protein